MAGTESAARGRSGLRRRGRGRDTGDGDAIALAALRERRGASQRELASALGVTQPRVWKIEHAGDVYLSSLRDYVAALGGRIEIAAVFDDGEVYALHVGDEASAAPPVDQRSLVASDSGV